jgi:hypothetical protein
VGALPVDGSDEEKRTNEIGMAIPLLEGQASLAFDPNGICERIGD